MTDVHRYPASRLGSIQDPTTTDFLRDTGLPAATALFAAADPDGDPVVTSDGRTLLPLGAADDAGTFLVDCDTGTVLYGEHPFTGLLTVNASAEQFAACLTRFEAATAGSVAADAAAVAARLESDLSEIDPTVRDTDFWLSLFFDVANGEYLD